MPSLKKLSLLVALAYAAGSFLANLSHATCCITGMQVDLRNYAPVPGHPHIDESTGWGHAFDVYVTMENTTHRQSSTATCKLEWWEWTDYVVPGLKQTGIEENKWYNHLETNPLSSTWYPWTNAISRLESGLSQSETVRISDYPAIGLSTRYVREGGEVYAPSKSRKLLIEVRVKSSDKSCMIQEASYFIEQDLSIKNGQPHDGFIQAWEKPDGSSPFSDATMARQH